jgi:hypothetical protein
LGARHVLREAIRTPARMESENLRDQHLEAGGRIGVAGLSVFAPGERGARFWRLAGWI